MFRQSTYACGFFLQATDAYLLSKGHLWSVRMKLNLWSVKERSLMVAVKERGTTAAGMPFMCSLQTATLGLSWQIEWDGRSRRSNTQASVVAAFVV